MSRRVNRFQQMLAARAETLELGHGMSREEAEAAAQQELVDKVTSRLDAVIKASTCSVCGRYGVSARGMCGRCYRRDLRKRQRTKTKPCAQCGKLFQATRVDAFLCSGKCRKRRLRDANRRPLEQLPAQNTGNQVAGLAHRTGETLRKPFSEMSALELSAYTLEDMQQMRREELAAFNDARNARGPALGPGVARMWEKIERQQAEAAAEARRLRDPFKWRERCGW